VQMQLPNTLPYMTEVMTCMHFQPPASDGNAYTHLYWPAANDTDEHPSGRGAITPRLRALSDLKVKLKTEMCKSHRLGSAKTGTGCYNYWKDLRPLVNKQATNAFWTIAILNSTKSVMLWGTALVQILIRNTPTGVASLPMQTAPSALALIVRFTYAQVANTLKWGTWLWNAIIWQACWLSKPYKRDHAVPTKLPTLT
jgi:hypothetical protein